MIPVSTQFKEAVYAPVRQTKAKIEFQIVDIDASPDATTTVTSEASISKKAQISDTVTELSGKLATLEPNYWKLDGSFVLPPKPIETGYQVGWWSNAICGADGTFSTPQVITMQFSKDHSSVGITLFFDTKANEYASDFTIRFYNSSNVLLYTETVTGNTLSKYLLEHTFSNYRKIVVTITKWATGSRRARVAEISFGIVYQYTGQEIINASILEELDTISNQVTANELKMTLDNQDKRFNILNLSGVYPALQKKQKINPYLGVLKASGDTEYIPMGIFYLSEWKSDEGTMTASFTAYDVMDLLAQDNFAGGTYSGATLYNIAQAVFTSAGITDYEIDTALQSITSSGSLEKMPHREALQLIAIAGMAAVYSDRVTGKPIIKQLSDTALDETIDFDNVFNSPKITLDVLINTIYIDNGNTVYTYVDPSKAADEQTLSITVNNGLITDATHAANVAAWILAEYKKRFLYEINWRMNPAIAVGDIVTVEDEFSENKQVRITKQEFNFRGYLDGKTNGKAGS
ncbi:hypothetical protein [Dehalobacter sp.]|uniref:hypothetical protein n=1 Tax=Dehalobacter sp. TaxID=1962289 RepID=UPI00258B2C36|nr:hypothetical protein [Dehalobacter sp.]MDJ0305396.1 hypothetical protein [Dehalobacter sp.]